MDLLARATATRPQNTITMLGSQLYRDHSFSFYNSSKNKEIFSEVCDKRLLIFVLLLFGFYRLSHPYCMSKKEWPILYSKLLYKIGQYFLDTQYNHSYVGILVTRITILKSHCSTCGWPAPWLGRHRHRSGPFLQSHRCCTYSCRVDNHISTVR